MDLVLWRHTEAFGLPGRTGLLDLARTYLETQARLWPELVGTAAVPAARARSTAKAAKSTAAAQSGPSR